MTQFISADIKRLGKIGWKLEVLSSSYYFFTTKEVFVFETKIQCQKKLLDLRTRGCLLEDDSDEEEEIIDKN